MKIGLIHNLYYPYNKGGAEKIVALLEQGFKELGHEVFIITTTPEEKKQEKNIYYLPSLYYHLNYLPPLLRLYWHFLNIRSRRLAKTLKRIIKKEKPDLIIAHNLMGLGLRSSKYFKSYGAKYIQVLHDVQWLHPSGLMYYKKEKQMSSLLAKAYQFLVKKNLGQADLIVSPSKWLLALYQKNNFFKKTKAEVWSNPLFSKTIEKSNNKKEKLFFAAGQLEKHKGFDTLITAFRVWRDPEIKLKIAGQGRALEDLKKLAGGDKRIEFLGQIDKTEIEAILNRSLALVVPSLCYENFPTIILESLPYNNILIGSNIGGTKELIDDLGGLTFEADNYLDLKEKMLSALANPQKYQTKNGSLSRFLDYKEYTKRLIKTSEAL